jgi:hypothetical protein
MPEEIRLVQIATTGEGRQHTLYGLSADGRVYIYVPDVGEWLPLSMALTPTEPS